MGTRIKTHITPKMRIISFVLAFVMVFVGLPYVGGNMEVKAEETGPNIYSDTKYSNIMGTSGHDVSTTEGHRYHYTGKITKAKVTMFDYVSDYEISGNYNQCWQNEQGYVDAYQGFNSWISNSSPSFDNSATSNSITVTYKSEYFASSDSVIAHIWRGSNESNDIPMTYDTTIGKFTCTFTPGNGICYPRAILFYKGNISGSDKTSDYNINMQTNHKYEFADRTQFTYYDTESKDPHGGLIYLWADGKTSKSTNIYWKQDVSGGKWYAPHGSDHRRWYWTESWLPTKFKVQDASNNWNTGDKNFSGSIKRGWTNVFDKDGDLTNSYFPAYLEADIDYSKYTNPLYFGCFWKDNEPSGYERSNTPSYNNFWWQANMGFKPYDTNNRGNASVQGLVKSELSGGAAGKLMDVRSTDSNPVELPYFSKTFNSTYIKYYDKDNTGDNINFPFYESYIAANSGYISGIVSGSDTANEKAKFYQFCSKDSNLQFVTTDVNDHKGYFTETTTPIIHGDTQDFLPFNATDSHNTDDGKDYNNHNLGFGAKFETTFKLQRDGCVGATKLEDGSLVDVDSDTRIHTIFEFTGDDDLWVFIDGNLVLDMGGAHLESNGRIDFATKTATAYRARTLGDGVSLQDVNLDYQEKSIDFTSLLKPDSFYTDTETGNTYYNPNVSHTLTVFYMERGMLDSNLLIRFNYSPEANFSKMKITEVTDFDNINEGLKNATMKAAEDDVFMYTVTNTNTKSEDVKTNSARFPVAAQSIRTNQSVTTQLTPGTGSPGTASIDFVPGAQDVPTAVANTSYLWVDEFADNSKIVGKSNGSGQLYLMYGTCKNLYPSAEETKVGKESSAEFEKQFTRNSTMAVLQSDTLYKPNRASSPGLFGDSNSVTGNRLSSVPTATRSVSAYYETTKIVKDRDKNTIPFINESNGTFTFKNDASVDAGSSVMLTEYFTNTPRTGAITIKKELPIGEIVSPANKAFTIKVRFEDVFGVSGVHADVASEYEQIKYKVYNNSGQVGGERTMGSSTMKVGGQTKTCGTISLEVGQWAAIENIPYNTKYIVDENEPYYAPDVTGNNTNVLEGTINGLNQAVSGNNATVKNFSHTLTIKEVTDFSTVNSGLLTYTKKAAENDVFKYTVSNEGTSSSDVVDSGLLAPTNEINIRNEGTSYATQLTANNTVEDTGYVYLDISGNVVNTDWSWSVSDALIAAYVNNGTTGKTVWGEYVSRGVYKYPLTIDGVTYNQMAFKRFDPNGTAKDDVPYVGEKNGDWNNSTSSTVIGGKTYVIRRRLSNGEYVNNETSQPTRRISVTSTTNNYDPDNITAVNGTKPVANTNYEWIDELAAPSNTFTNTTGNDGGLYLMHGEDSNNTNSSTTHISSATFYNQFKRDNNSIMTVEQVNTLYSPDRTQTPADLGDTGQRTSNTLGTYYTMSKSLSGSQTVFSPADSNSFVYNDLNANKSVRITETFTNQVNVGSLKITKAINPTEDTNYTQTNAKFTFKITLTNVFGVTNNNVLNGDYDDIIVKKNDNSYTLTPAANSSNNYATFTLNVGDVLTIEKIPVGTHYVIEELSNDDSTKTEYNYELNKIYKKVDTSSNTGTYTEQTGVATITGDIVSGETHDFKVDNKRKTGTLTVSKSLIGDDNNTNVNSNTTFHFKVQLTKPDGVTFKSGNNEYYPITCKNSDTTNATYDYDYNYVIVTAKKDGTATISGIPYGTEYTVTEVADSAGNPISNDTNYPNVVYDNKQSGTINSPSTVATTVKNIYRKITLTKEDSKDNDKKLNGAVYYLLKLNDAFDTAYTANPTAVENTFKSAEHYGDTSLTPYYSGYSGTLTTGNSNGTLSFNDTVSITLTDTSVTHGITPGKYFLFEETAPNNNYERDNSFTYTDSNNQTHSKIITVQDTDDNPTYSVTYGDPRKTGKIVINKELFEGTDATTYGDTEFTFKVELDGTDGDGTDVDLDLSKYGIKEKFGTAASQDITSLTYDESTHKYTGTITVTKNAPVTIENIPYGTSYSISEAPTGQWKKISEIGTPALSGTINVDLPDVGNIDTATITTTNALTGTLQLSKALTGDYNANGKNTTDSFYFDVTLITPDDISQSTLNSIVSGATFTQDATNTRKFTSTVSVQGNSTPVSISGLPYGTTYSVVEADESQNKTQSITYALNSTAGAIKNKTIDAANVVTTTNNYPELGQLEIVKTITGDGASTTQPFTFTVTLTPQSGTLIDLKDFNFTYDGTKATLSDDHKSFTVTLKGGESLNISGIPVGTGYSVAESTPPSGWELTSQTGESGTISTTPSTATFANTFTRVYKTVILQKIDASRNNALLTSSPATFRLLRLESTYTWTDASVLSAFEAAIKNDNYATYVANTYPSSSTEYTTGTSGQFTVSEQAVDFGDDYFFFYEVSAPEGYHTDNSVTSDKIFKVDADEVIVRYSNTPNSTNVTVIKQDKDTGDGLENAEFELWYQDVKMPSTYSINKSVSKPLPSDSVQINASSKPSVPADAEGESTTVDNYTETTNYTAVAAPDAEETEWILPRTDNDYIYFRDYNKGTSLHTGSTGDQGAFGNSDPRSWIGTGFGTNPHGQSEELIYDTSYQIEAQFTKEDNDNDMVKYNVWERFVEDYSSTGVRDAVVWKIQPPDGYHYVRFCLKQNGTYLRTTARINYKLGYIYTKNGINYKDARWNYPVSEEKFSTYYTTQSTNGTNDKRLESTTELHQADRYTATPQKIIFHCNSKKVWHNIHIEFFTNENNGASTVSEAENTYYYVGQKAPGYMMEPYAYAGDDYRVNGYLTYELTIPKDAKYFRVNDGVSGGDYNYRSKITALYQGTEIIDGKATSSYKNYHNYFMITAGDVNVSQSKAVTLTDWTGIPSGDNLNTVYSATNEIESDADYVYFAVPEGSGWGDHIYAYFYGGGNLRRDNRQRACYTVWPGLEPVSSEYTTYTNKGDTTGTDTHSDIYGYSYTGNLYNSGNESATPTNPETTFSYTRNSTSYKVYKFRIPLGERRNYDHVIFNDGLSRYSTNDKETDVINYTPGFIYYADRSSDSHYYSLNTDVYSSTRGDYLYIKMDNTTLNTWDDLHVKFYNASGTEILQGGTGYVMKYAGTKSGETYFKILVPDNAAKFSLNNGYSSYNTSNNTKTIGIEMSKKYDILPKVATATASGQTQGDMVYKLTGTTSADASQSSHIDYSERGDTLYIKNSAGWTIGRKTTSPANTGGVVQFYDANDTLIIGNGYDGNGTYYLIETVADSASTTWYHIQIPVGAESFTLTYNNGSNTTAKTPIFVKTTAATGTAENFTNGDMYYETQSGGTFSLLYPTFTGTPNATNYNDDNYSVGRRGDALYLICSDASAWSGMYIIFYDANGNTINNNASTPTDHIHANYIGSLGAETDQASAVTGVTTAVEAAQGYWFRVYIPKGAVSFRAYSGTKQTAQGEIYELRSKAAIYRNDYTLGDMQYRIGDLASSGSYPLTMFYPMFTENPAGTVPGSDDTSSVLLADETNANVSTYSSSNPVSIPTDNHTSALPVLYPTSSNNISYTYGSEDLVYACVRFEDVHTWESGSNVISAIFSDGSTTSTVSHETTTGTSNGHTVYYFRVPTSGNYNKVYFTNGTNRTVEITLAGNSTDGYGHGYMFYPAQLTDSTYSQSFTTYNNNYLVQVKEPSNTSVTISVTKTENTDGTRQYLYWEPKSPYTNVQKCWFYTGNGTGYISPDNVYIKNSDNISDKDQIIGDTGKTGPNGYNIRIVKIPADATYVKFACTQDNNTFYETENIQISTIAKGYGLTQTGTSGTQATTGTFKLSDYSLNDGSVTTTYSINNITYPTNVVSGSIGTPEITVNYQPEDRYALISDITGTSDTNNFIKIVNNTDITDPYIVFYDSSSNIIGGQTNGIGLKYTKINGAAHAQTGAGTEASPYLIRLPKNAVSFRLGNGTNTIGTNAIPLYEDFATTNNGGSVTINNYHHAGTTFTIDSTGAVTNKERRTTSTIEKSAITYPLTFKTDKDYIYFTDVGNILKGSGSTLYAYYYGGYDGAYFNDSSTHYTDTNNTSWCGVPAQTTYTDNSGNTVYVFQPPSSDNGNYPYVIFNNGGYDSNTRITQAVQYVTGKNYTTNGTATTGYGETTVAARTYQVQEVSGASPKTTASTVHYDTTATNGQYLYFVDNGTYNFGISTLPTRYTLDDLHITFFADDKGTLPIGTAAPGYKMDKITTSPDNVYRITIPNGANYFQINNGQQKTSGTTNNNYRQSVIQQLAANGIYQFVTETDTAKVWDCGSDTTAPTAIADLNKYNYYLKLNNPITNAEEEVAPETTTEDVWLATVVTGDGGTQKYIKALRTVNGEVDKTYLDHTTADIGEGAGITAVKVVKKGNYYWKETVAPSGYKITTEITEFSVTGSDTVTSTVYDEAVTGEVILTKTAKEKVGSTEIGTALAGAKFQLLKIEGSTEIDTLRFTKSSATGTTEYSLSGSGSENVTNLWLETGTAGKLKITGLQPGDYCLVEQEAPENYSAKDSNTGANKRVYFSVGDNTVTKNIICSDEMDAAYIRLFEHINEKKAAWGDPTFIFKIKNTDTGKTNLVSLTVNDDGTIDDTTNHRVLKWMDGSTEQPFTADPINNTLYGNWLVEATSETEYKGMYHIDSQGRIRVEPGNYEISRMPVSRYKFVTSGHIVYDTNTTTDPYLGSFTTDATQKVTINDLEAGKTADVHYYDEVEYYDKFSHVDEQINKFYKLENGANKTIKGIRIEDYHTGASGTLNLTGSNLTVYAIYADGTESQITDAAELGKITFSYTAAEGDTSAFACTSTDNGKTLNVTDVATYNNKVYTITATYDSKFITTFDLVFARS